eukprot:COSAG03_NODE_18_length_21685_cov_15.938988_2_plen_169_part_00
MHNKRGLFHSSSNRAFPHAPRKLSTVPLQHTDAQPSKPPVGGNYSWTSRSSLRADVLLLVRRKRGGFQDSHLERPGAGWRDWQQVLCQRRFQTALPATSGNRPGARHRTQKTNLQRPGIGPTLTVPSSSPERVSTPAYPQRSATSRRSVRSASGRAVTVSRPGPGIAE